METIDNFVEDVPVEGTEQPMEEAIPEELPELILDAIVPAPQAEQVLEVVYPPEEEELPPRRSRIRPEIIMGIIAAFCAVLLTVMVLLCRPFMQAVEEDPEAFVERHQTEASAPILEPTIPPEPEETEETAEPTIPPESNPYGRLDFQYNNHNYLYCLQAESYSGIDVSAFQGEIDWQKVADSGIDFAIIRLGYRGYGKAGRLVEDDYAQQNLEGATEAGLPIGAYFFSQALTIQETDEEIEFMLEILGDYKLDMPIILDWEIPGAEAPRTAGMDARTLTDIQRHFCGRMRELGYEPMIYFNWHQSEHLYYLTELEEYPFWLALYQDRMTYPWKVEMWQYTDQGRVPGIVGNVDINVYMPE